MSKLKMLQAIATIEAEAVEQGIYHLLKRNINGLKAKILSSINF